MSLILALLLTQWGELYLPQGHIQNHLLYGKPAPLGPAFSALLTSASSLCTSSPTAEVGGPLTFTRASTAYLYDTSANCSSGQARLDPSGILLERSRQNEALQSQTLATTWTTVSSAGNGLTVNSDATTAPDGTTTAENLVFAGSVTAAGQYNSLRQTMASMAASTRYTFSIFLKSSNISQVSLYASNGTSYFITQTCSVSSSWTRCTATGDSGTTNASAHIDVGAIFDTGGQTLSAGTLSAWGAQMERTGFATAYTPTTTVGAQRNNEVLTANLNGVTHALGSFAATYTPEASNPALTNAFGATTPYILLLKSGASLGMLSVATATGFTCRWVNAASVNNDASQAVSITKDTAYKVVCSWNSAGNVCISVNNAAATCTAVSGSARTLDSFSVGGDPAGAGPNAYARISAICMDSTTTGCN